MFGAFEYFDSYLVEIFRISFSDLSIFNYFN